PKPETSANASASPGGRSNVKSTRSSCSTCSPSTRKPKPRQAARRRPNSMTSTPILTAISWPKWRQSPHPKLVQKCEEGAWVPLGGCFGGGFGGYLSSQPFHSLLTLSLLTFLHNYGWARITT